MTFKTIVGYDIVPGVSEQEYERWLFEVHVPDLLANPYLERIVFNKVLGPVRDTSGGAARVPHGYDFYRIAEMHYPDQDAYRHYLEWFDEHPIAPERGPAGRTDFKFYLATDCVEVTRDWFARRHPGEDTPEA